jgi:alpha-1,2-mannosyltransferase
MATKRTGLFGAALIVVVGVEIAAYAVLIGRPHLPQALLLALINTPVWVLAVVLLAQLRLSFRSSALLILGVSAVLQIVAVSHAPSTSDDDYRYVWDAKVQLHGIDPYRYTPSAPQLAELREAWMFGPPDHCQYPFPGGCTSINRPTVHTIYPPVAEAAFDIARIVSFGDHGHRRPLQIAGLLGALLVGWLLLRWTYARGRPWLAAVWAWCPIVITEYANNAHIDWLAVLIVVIAFATGVVRRTGWAAALVGAAIAVKLYPALVLPSLMRRHPVVAVGSAIGVVVLVYVPHVIAVGSAVIGYLPGYLKEENYSSGKRLLLLGAVLPDPVDTVVGGLIVAAVAVWAWRRGDDLAPERSAVIVVGTAFLTFTPSYGWYTGLLLALVVLSGALEWAALCFAATFAFLVHTDHDVLIYGLGALLAALIAVVRPRIERWNANRAEPVPVAAR